LRVVHIAGGFAKQALYPNLVAALRLHCTRQFVFAAVRTAAEKQRQPEDLPGVVEYAFEYMLGLHHRIMFRRKVRSVYDRLQDRCDITGFDLIHAHTLYSDGAVALRAKDLMGVPYIVAFRNTDLNVFMRFRPDLGGVGRRVLAEAERVVFLSPAYRHALLARLTGNLRRDVGQKSIVVPNGVASIWLERQDLQCRRQGDELRLLYVGEFSRNKNVRSVLDAGAQLSKQRKVRLILVGGGGNDERGVRRSLANGQYPFAKYIGRISDPKQLRSIYRDNDIFVMPSHKETFGIVYLEALSQGLPIIHSRGQGVDGFFQEGTVSAAVDPTSIGEIIAAIERLADGLERVRPQCVAEARRFSWIEIAAKYGDIYSTASGLRPVASVPSIGGNGM
jgi:L-malate glycosyltransferase